MRQRASPAHAPARASPRRRPPARPLGRWLPDGSRWRGDTARGSRARRRPRARRAVPEPGPRDGEVAHGKRQVHALDEPHDPHEQLAATAARPARPPRHGPGRSPRAAAGRSRSRELARSPPRPSGRAAAHPGSPRTPTPSGVALELERSERLVPGARPRTGDLGDLRGGPGCRCAPTRVPAGSRSAVASNVVATTRAQRAASD